MKEHAAWEELAAGHALSALEPEEEQDFLRHLRGCDLCARTLAEMKTIGAELAYAVEPVDPPASLLASIKDAVQRENRPVITPGMPAQGSPVGGDELASRRQRRTLAPRGSWLSSAAALILVIVLGLWNATLRSEVRTQEAALSLRAQLEELVTAPGTRVIPLGQPGAAAHGSAVIHDRRVMLVISGLAPNVGRTSYVLWARDRSNTMHAVKAFAIINPDRPNVIPEMELPRVDGAVLELAVSQEILASGDELPDTPSGTPFLRGQLA